MYQILTHSAASITELKTNPMQLMENAEGAAVAILNRNEPVFYCVPAELYEEIMDVLEDIELAKIVKEREGGPTIEVPWDKLITAPGADDDV